jgi:hypothetical protein
MSMQAPISHHLVLYDYWLAKRGSRSMPARRDLNPADIPKLLPYLMIVEKDGEQFRYRLVGTAVVREFGNDGTGGFVGSSLADPGVAAAVRAIYERVFTTGHPVFNTGEFKTVSGSIHHVSLFILPLSDDGADVNMSISSVIARFGFGVAASAGWLSGAPVKIRDMVDIDSAAELEKRCLDWERYCDDQRRRAVIAQ